MNKNYVKHIVVIELIKAHDAGILLPNGGEGCVHSNPRFFLRRTRPLQVSSCREIDVVFESGGGAAPPQPPRCLFKQCRLAFKNIAPSRRTASGTCLHHPSCQQRQNPSGRVIKTLCLQVERAAPVTRTVSSTYNCDTEFFKAQSTGLLLANGAHGAPAFL